MIGRWIAHPESYLALTDPRYATEQDCQQVEAELWAQIGEFHGAPKLSVAARDAAERVLGRKLRPGTATCILTREQLTFDGLKTAVKITTNQVGSAELPVEYRKDLRRGGLHRPGNLGWIRTATDLVTLRDVLARNGVPNSLLAKVQVKAYATDKVTMPPHFSNRDYRWATWTDSIQFASRAECQAVELELLSQILEFQGAPQLSAADRVSVERHLGRSLSPNTRQCSITGQPMQYAAFVDAVVNPAAGKSPYHVGHLVPLTRGGRHERLNVVWMSEQGNRIQGNDTLDEIVALIHAAAQFHRGRTSGK